MTVGATAAGQLCVYELSNPADGWNWTAEPSLCAAGQSGRRGPPLEVQGCGLGQGGRAETDDPFPCAAPPMELKSEWWARPGRGPVHHTMLITNQSDKPLAFSVPPTIQLDFAGPAGDGALASWTFHSDGPMPDPVGVYHDTIQPPYHRQIVTHPEGAFIPDEVFDAGGKHGVYVGVEWSYCRIEAAAAAGRKAGAVRVRGGEFEGFKVSVAPGETFETPPAFVGALPGRRGRRGQ